MKQTSVVGIVLVVAFLGGIWAAIEVAPSKVPPFEPEYVYFQAYPESRPLPDFSLQRADGSQFTLADLQQQWTLLFLGYTFCPDICPATMAALNRIYPQLQQLNSDAPVKVMFVSVDPQRDTAERLASYKQHFNDAFIAASAPHAQLFPFVRSLGLMYSMPESTEQDSYLVDHSGSVAVLDPQGRLVGRFKPEATPGRVSIANPKHILIDLPKLIDYYQHEN